MYRVEPKHKFSNADITRPDYIQPIDFLRPTLYGFVLGAVYMAFVVGMFMVADPTRAGIAMLVGSSSLVMCAVIYAVAGLTGAIGMHATWLTKLKSGRHLFERQLSVQIPSEHAFELCLAAAAHLKNPRVTGFDEEHGYLRIVSEAPWWSTSESTQLDVHLQESIDGVTHISVVAQKALTNSRLSLLRLVWGDKWMPIVLTLPGTESSSKLMDQFVDFINAHPNWNYRHIPHYVPEVVELAS